MGICMLLPDEVEQGQVLVDWGLFFLFWLLMDLGQFFVRCSLSLSLSLSLSVMYVCVCVCV